MRKIKSLKNHSSCNPYAAFDLENDKFTICANFQAKQKGRWRCELHIEDGKKTIKETVISKPKEYIGVFLDCMIAVADEAFDELTNVTTAHFQIYLMSRK